MVNEASVHGQVAFQMSVRGQVSASIWGIYGHVK